MVIIKTTSAFRKLSSKLLNEVLLEELYVFISANPESGKIIPGTGGVRKLRWKSATNNKGKSGGVRILYHYHQEILILLLTLYSKSDQDSITDLERAELKRKLPLLIAEHMEDL